MLGRWGELDDVSECRVLIKVTYVWVQQPHYSIVSLWYLAKTFATFPLAWQFILYTIHIFKYFDSCYVMIMTDLWGSLIQLNECNKLLRKVSLHGHTSQSHGTACDNELIVALPRALPSFVTWSPRNHNAWG